MNTWIKVARYHLLQRFIDLALPWGGRVAGIIERPVHQVGLSRAFERRFPAQGVLVGERG